MEPEEKITIVPDGVANFLEHKLFEDDRGNVFDRLAALGASANAFTLGGYIRRFNSLEFIANNFLAYRFRNTDLFELPSILQEVRREEALALFEENLDPARHAVSLILPVDSE